jgi:hypothetical protein
MLRMFLSLVLALGLVGLAGAADKDTKDKDKDKNEQKATITKVDPKNHTITLKMKDKDGKETERVFKLTEDIRYLDSTGKVAAIDVFTAGDWVLIVEEEGRIKEMKKAKPKSTAPKEKEGKR